MHPVRVPSPPPLFSVYLLTPRSTDRAFLAKTYVGFTTNLARRIRQHNKEIKGGAWKTSKHEQWAFVCHVGGFTSKVSALQFEWMWQHPTRSKLSRDVITAKVKGQRGTGRAGSVKRKMIELSWLLSLVVDKEPGLHLRLNNALFGNGSGGGISAAEYWDKIGIQVGEEGEGAGGVVVEWPSDVQLSCCCSVEDGKDGEDGEEGEEEEQFEVLDLSLEDNDDDDAGITSSSSEEEEEDARPPPPMVIDLVTPTKPKV